MAYCLQDISIIPRIERISVSDPMLSLSTRLTRRVNVNYPFVASPMDCVISYEMAILMANYGIVPIFHIRESNQVHICNIIRQYIDQSSGIFGISTPTSPDFIDQLMQIDLMDHCSIVALDTLHTKPYNHLKTIEHIRRHYKNLDIISGNVTNAEDCLRVINCGVDAVRVGMTSNSVNKGYEITGCGRQQATAIYECANISDKHNIPIIADGGINTVSDISKSIALGASSVMMGKMFAAMDESPCKITEYEGVKYKEYKGMSRGDIIDSDMLPEGSVILVKMAGRFNIVINEWIRRLKIAVVRSGSCNLSEMRENCILEYYVNKR